MDLLNYDSSSDSDAAPAAGGRKRARDGGALPAASAAGAKAPRTSAGAAAASPPAAPPPAPPFSTLDAEAQCASATARRAANALFERRVVGGAARQGAGELRAPPAEPAPPQAAAAAAAAAAAPARALGPFRALDLRTLGLLDARSRKELGLSDAGQWGAAHAGASGSAPPPPQQQQQPWGLPAAPAGGIVEVSGRQVRNSAWETAHLEAMAASAAAAGGGGGGARRAAAAPIAATVWSHATGRAEVSVGATRAQKSKHQINTLAAAAVSHNLRAADRAAEASMQAALARQASGGRT